jgi:hypothetical protein
MRDLRAVALEYLLFLLALPMLVLGITFGATFLWGGLTFVADQMLDPLFRDKDPYAWVLRLGMVEVVCYGTWWWRKRRNQPRPVARTARPVRLPPARPPLPARETASRTIRAA